MKCPNCQETIDEIKGSSVSPYLNTYKCTKCGWKKLKCGNTSCDGYLEPEEMGYPNTVRYNCSKCGWSGTGIRFF